MTILKYIISIFLITVSSNVFCQSIARDFLYWQEDKKDEPSLINYADSLVMNEIDNSIYGVDNKRYLFETRYILKNGNEVFVNIFSDNTILYREYLNGKPLHQGELTLDHKRPYLFEKHDDLTGETIGIDTTYFLIPNGTWILNENNKNYEKGLFVKGIKVGDWEIIDKQKFYFPVAHKKYNHGELTDSVKIDFSKSENIYSLIAKDWIRRGTIVDRENDFIYVLFVTNDSNAIHFGLSLEILFSELHLSNDLNYTAKQKQSCGTSPIKENYQNPTGKWKVTRDNKNQNLLNVDNEQFQIEYLTEKELIIKIKKGL